MATLSAARLTSKRPGTQRVFPVKANVKIWEGGLVSLNGGVAIACDGLAAHRVVAVATENADNTGGADGDIKIPTDTGVFRFDNDGGDPIAEADIGNTCYATDDHTVAKTSNSSAKPAAGTIFDVDAQGVWVKVG